MTTDEIYARDAAAQALGILEDEGMTIEDRVEAARGLLKRAVRGRPLREDERAALDADPSVQEVMAAIRASANGPYYASGPDGLPTGEVVDLTGAQPFSEADLDAMGV